MHREAELCLPRIDLSTVYQGKRLTDDVFAKLITGMDR